MKAAVAFTFSLLLATASFAGVADSQLAAHLAGARRVEIFGSAQKGGGRATLLSSYSEREIRKIAGYFLIVDPPPPNEAGEEIVLTCFCIDDFVVRFTLADGSEFSLGLRHSYHYIVPSRPLASSSIGNLELKKSSSSKLRRVISKFEKRANQSPQRNAGSRPSSGGSSASETPSSLGPRG